MTVYLPGLLYTKTHEWVKIEQEGDQCVATSGISDYAQEELNDVVYVELPEEGDEFEQGETYAVIESVKAASDIEMPLSGEIIAVNRALEDNPQLVNEDPYGQGWIIKLRVRDRSEADQLLDAAAYEAFIAEEG